MEETIPSSRPEGVSGSHSLRVPVAEVLTCVQK